jgi:hypothetical protein
MLKITFLHIVDILEKRCEAPGDLCHRIPLTITTPALISFAASGYCCMASYRCLRVTICTTKSYFTRCEGVKGHGYRHSERSWRRELLFQLKPEILSIVTDARSFVRSKRLTFCLTNQVGVTEYKWRRLTRRLKWRGYSALRLIRFTAGFARRRFRRLKRKRWVRFGFACGPLMM